MICTMTYRAGVQGLEYLGFASCEPGWLCLCGGWAFPAKRMGGRASGNNLLEAEASFLAHSRASSGHGAAAGPFDVGGG